MPLEDALTEAEFRAFSARLSEFVRDLTPNERLFLTAILARACARPEPALDQFAGGADWEVCADLAYSIWQSMRFPYGTTSRNPQPMPSREAKP